MDIQYLQLLDKLGQDVDRLQNDIAVLGFVLVALTMFFGVLAIRNAVKINKLKRRIK